MKKGRLIKGLLVVVLLLPMAMGLLVPGTYMASETEDAFEYIEEDGQITIKRYLGSDELVIVPSEIDGKPVGTIGDKAFEESEVREVTLSEGITSIGLYAFRRCSNLESIRIPHSVDRIEGLAFYECKSLREITIPHGVTSIESSTFTRCTSLEVVSLPNSITQLGSLVFEGCTSLKTIHLPDGIESIDYRTFHQCENLEEVVLPKNLKRIPTAMFEGCNSLGQITIPDGVTAIGARAFQSCSSLSEITLPDSLTKIDNNVFKGCKSLLSIRLPKGISSIGEDAFNTGNKNFTIYGYGNPDVLKYMSDYNHSFIQINDVTFDSQGGTSVEGIVVEHNSTIDQPPTPTRLGYEFLGWYRDEDGIHPWGFDTDTVIEDLFLYAKWRHLYISPPSVQIKMDTTMDSPSTTMRFISGIESIEDLKEVGFVTSFGNVNPSLDEEDCTFYATKRVYQSIYAGEELIFGEFFDRYYIAALTSEEIPREDFTREIHVRPYVKLKDGVVLYGEVGSFTVEGCIQAQGEGE